MTGWEYLSLEVIGHNGSLRKVQNMLVTTSGGRWRDEKMPNDVAGLVNQLGAEGWEMVNCSGTNLSSSSLGVVPFVDFGAAFKRPRQ